MPALLQPGVPGVEIHTQLCRAQVPSFLLCLPLPAHGARASLASLPSPATLGDICACCCDTGGNVEPPTPIPWGWTDVAAGLMDTLVSHKTWPGRRWSWGSGKDQTSGLGGFSACPGPPSPALPGDLLLLTIIHTQPHLAWHGDTPGPSPCLRTSPPVWGVPILSDPVLDRPCVGTDLTAALGGATVAPLPHLFTARACPSSVGTAPLTRDSWREFLLIS